MDYGLRLWTKVCVMDTQLLSSQGINCSTGVVCIIVMFLSAVWTFILTAPIHCRACIAETLMHFSKSVLMNKQSHPPCVWHYLD